MVPERITESVAGVAGLFVTNFKAGWVSVAGREKQDLLMRISLSDGNTADLLAAPELVDGIVQILAQLLAEKQTRN